LTLIMVIGMENSFIAVKGKLWELNVLFCLLLTVLQNERNSIRSKRGI